MGGASTAQSVARAGAGTFGYEFDSGKRSAEAELRSEFGLLSDTMASSRDQANIIKDQIQTARGRLTTMERDRSKVDAEIRNAQRALETFQRENPKASRRDLDPYERRVGTARLRKGQLNNSILTEAGRIEAFRQAYNDRVKAGQEEQKLKQQRQRQRTKTGTSLNVPVDTTTPFESLSGEGLLGWQRQRPAGAPDYTAFDRATPGQPASLDFPGWETTGDSTSTKTQLYRDVTRTPEGAPVRVIMPDAVTSRAGMPTFPGLANASVDDIAVFTQNDPRLARDLSGGGRGPQEGGVGATRTFDAQNAPSSVGRYDTISRRSSWINGVARVGNQIFDEQRSNNTEFWDRENPNGQPITFGSRNATRPGFGVPRVRDYVSRHAAYTAPDTNGYLRGSGRQGMYRDRENAYMEETLRGIRRQQTAGDVDAGTLNARRREFQQIVDRREERREEIAALDSAMRSAPETILTRRSIDPRVYERMRQTLRPGDRFTDDAFTSVSIDPTANLGVPGQPGSMMNVILTEGTPTLWAGGSRSPGTQNEVIIGRGTTFEVVSANNEQGWVLRTVPSSSGYNPPPVPNYVSPDVSAFIAEAPPPPRNPTPNDLTFSPSLDRFRLYRQDFSRPQIGSDTETRVGVWDQIIRESRQGEQDILRARVMEGKKMYFKHLRGKHD